MLNIQQGRKEEPFGKYIPVIVDDAISTPSVPGRKPGADSVATNKDGIEESAAFII